MEGQNARHDKFFLLATVTEQQLYINHQRELNNRSRDNILSLTRIIYSYRGVNRRQKTYLSLGAWVSGLAWH